MGIPRFLEIFASKFLILPIFGTGLLYNILSR